MTGPSYPFAGSTHLKNGIVNYNLPRSHGGDSPAIIKIHSSDSTVHGYVEWKRYKTSDTWTRTSFLSTEGNLTAELPLQPQAGKLLYRVALYRGDEIAVIPGDEPLVIRFKGEVPLMILIPHIIAMFASMLLAARAGLEFFGSQSNLRKLTYWTIGFLLVGGFVFGPIVQQYAFGALWTGWPFGTDLTDNKTAVALLAWIAVGYALKKSRTPKTWALAASIITFIVFLVPHSMLGSEYDFNAQVQQKMKVDTLLSR
jgi:hypothetical protein